MGPLQVHQYLVASGSCSGPPCQCSEALSTSFQALATHWSIHKSTRAAESEFMNRPHRSLLRTRQRQHLRLTDVSTRTARCRLVFRPKGLSRAAWYAARSDVADTSAQATGTGTRKTERMWPHGWLLMDQLVAIPRETGRSARAELHARRHARFDPLDHRLVL